MPHKKGHLSEALKKRQKGYRSKTRPEVTYSSIIPGARATPGRIEHEGHMIRGKRMRRKIEEHPTWGKRKVGA